MTSTSCLHGRIARIRLRQKADGAVRDVELVVPSRWQKAALLGYVRSHHPAETVRILEWGVAGVWLPNPDAFADFRTGTLA